MSFCRYGGEEFCILFAARGHHGDGAGSGAISQGDRVAAVRGYFAHGQLWGVGASLWRRGSRRNC